MPLTIRDKASILQSILGTVLSGTIVTDLSAISVIRQLCDAVASEEADRAYELYSLLQDFYLSTATDTELDARGQDMGLVRDPGQAASDGVLFSKTVTMIDDIPLPAPQVVTATLADGTIVRYRSIQDLTLQPSGRSVSGQAPATTLSSGVNDTLVVNLDSDGPRTIVLGTLTSAAAIASTIQAQMRALTALSPVHQPAYTSFRCDYGVTTAGAYTLRSGTAGTSSSVVVTAATTNNGTGVLKLGVASGGIEQVGMGSLLVPVVCDTIGVLGNVGAGQINQLATGVTGIESVANPLAFSNGTEPASDDAYRQDVRSYILGLGRGTQDAIERAVFGTVGSDGQRHVMSAQVVAGTASVQVFLCDGRSLTVGAQPDTIQDVQDELDGLGLTVGGWIADGTVVGVVSATVLTVNVTVQVLLGPTPDLVRAQNAITNALYQLLYTWPVGQALSYATMTRRIDDTVVEMLGTTYMLPQAFATNPPTPLGGGLGQKLMPGALSVGVQRA